MAEIIALLPAYAAYLRDELRRADATVTGYLSDLHGLAASIRKPVEQMDRNDLRAYVRGLTTARPATVRRKIGGFSTFWKWLEMEQIVTTNATKGIVAPRKEKTVPRWLSEDELHRFVETRDNDLNNGFRNDLAWLLLAWLGLRRDELRKLRVRDVNFADGVIVIRETKTKRDRTLPIPFHLARMLAAATLERPATAYVLPGDKGGFWSSRSFYKAFNAHAATADLPGITPQTLRHTVATHMSQRGVPLRVIQQFMGHERLETTSIYMHVAPDFMTSAIEKHILNEVKSYPNPL